MLGLTLFVITVGTLFMLRKCFIDCACQVDVSTDGTNMMMVIEIGVFSDGVFMNF